MLLTNYKNSFEIKTSTTVNLVTRCILLGGPHLIILFSHFYNSKMVLIHNIEIINIIKYHQSIKKFILSEKEEIYAHATLIIQCTLMFSISLYNKILQIS